jgi:hypothetical protein
MLFAPTAYTVSASPTRAMPTTFGLLQSSPPDAGLTPLTTATASPEPLPETEATEPTVLQRVKITWRTLVKLFNTEISPDKLANAATQPLPLAVEA